MEFEEVATCLWEVCCTRWNSRYHINTFGIVMLQLHICPLRNTVPVTVVHLQSAIHHVD